MSCLGCLNWHLAEVGQVFGGGGVGGVSTGSAGLQIYQIYSKAEACLKILTWSTRLKWDLKIWNTNWNRPENV